MDITPQSGELAALLEQSPGGVLLYAKMLADTETPVSAMQKLAPNLPYSCLLESVEGGNVRGRFSVIALDPDLIWLADDDKAWKTTPDGAPLGGNDTDIFASLKTLIDESRLAIPDDLPPMAAGLFGYFGYEMVHQMERLPLGNPDLLGVPNAILMRPQIVVIFDRLKDEMTICTPCRKHDGKSADDLWREGADRIAKAMQALDAPLADDGSATTNGTDTTAKFSSNMEPTDFHDMVSKAIEYTKAGDIFQVTLSQRFSMPFDLPPFNLYRVLRRLNPSPFLIYFNFGDMSLVGSSPEILVRLRDGTVTIRPLAGTRPRGATAEEDKANADDLIRDSKERAEHLMLLDLGRNDVGRVARPGTVRVVESFTIERYSHVMHIASEVEGKIRDGLDAVDALKAGFPAGTLSGAPKIRAMEIIDELEPCRRGPYAGAAGYISADGDMDTCIILRTAVLKDGMMHAQAGAGIVYDSVPESEFKESENKAMALMRAAAEALKK